MREENPINTLKNQKGKTQDRNYSLSANLYLPAQAIVCVCFAMSMGVRICYAYNDLIKLHDYGLQRLNTFDDTMNFKLAHQSPSGLSVM